MTAQKVVAATAETPAQPAGPKGEVLALGEFSLDGGTQMRAGINPATVAEYAEHFAEFHGWGTFPPVEVVYDGSSYWVWDGFHRLAAFRQALAKDPARISSSIPALVRPGTRRDAVLLAAGANAAHGLRRTVEDKRRAVDALLADPEWGDWSDNAIARAARVSAPFVASRRDLRDQSAVVAASVGNGAAHVPAAGERRYIDRDGVQRTMRTDGIVAAQAARAKPAPVMASAATGARQDRAEIARCSVCNRPLSDPAHAAAGMGPVCACKQIGAGGDAADDEAEIARYAVPRQVAIRNMRGRWLSFLDDLPFYEEQTGDRAGARAVRALVSAMINRLEVAQGA